MALSMVSKKFRILIFPQLFKVLIIKANDETSLWDLKRNPYFAYNIIARVPNVLIAVKELHFRAPFELTGLAKLGDRKRCPHLFTRGLVTRSRSSPGSEKDDFPILLNDSDIVSRNQEKRKGPEGFFDGEHEDYKFIKLGTKIARLLSALPDNQLAGFK